MFQYFSLNPNCVFRLNSMNLRIFRRTVFVGNSKLSLKTFIKIIKWRLTQPLFLAFLYQYNKRNLYWRNSCYFSIFQQYQAIRRTFEIRTANFAVTKYTHLFYWNTFYSIWTIIWYSLCYFKIWSEILFISNFLSAINLLIDIFKRVSGFWIIAFNLCMILYSSWLKYQSICVYTCT